MFADTGIPKFLKAISAQGAPLERLIISVAGGADFLIKGKSMFTVGKQNIEKVIGLLRKNNINVTQQTIGGTTTRDLFIDLDTGKSWVAAAKKGLDQ